ncbi:THAP domain-containing protein 1-like isoform X1 [Tigriopus californicus]|uniref:THAP domain-containing protein 1-like isoform X1 n=1 Tax=Tigriopus californicus TaxID=6832 RepID=UPI0027DA070D|nr:THAP domain-containing protein 1-like isoform X1 [Tigriopus californicus]
MVLRCAAKGCHTKHDGSIEQSFFKFPKQNLKLRQQWLDLLDIPDFVPKPTSSVCWKHFHPSAMKIKWNPNRDKNIRPRRRLVINAVPDYQGPYENQGTETSIWPDETCCLPTIPNDTEEPLEAEESEIFLPSGDAQARLDPISNVQLADSPLSFESEEFDNDKANGDEMGGSGQSFPDHAYAKSDSIPKQVTWRHACSKDDQIVDFRRKVKRLQDYLRNGERRIRMLKSDPKAEFL